MPFAKSAALTRQPLQARRGLLAFDQRHPQTEPGGRRAGLEVGPGHKADLDSRRPGKTGLQPTTNG